MVGETYIVGAIIGVGLIYLVHRIGYKLAEDHGPLKIFLIWLSIILLVPVANIGMEIATAAELAPDIQTMTSTLFYVVMFINIAGGFYLGWYIFGTIIKAMLASRQWKKSPLRRV